MVEYVSSCLCCAFCFLVFVHTVLHTHTHTDQQPGRAVSIFATAYAVWARLFGLAGARYANACGLTFVSCANAFVSDVWWPY